MYRHPFDSVSFFFGLLFAAGALSALLADDPWPFGHGRLWPILLIAGGVFLVAASIGTARRSGLEEARPVEARSQELSVEAAPPIDPLLAAAHREVDDFVDPSAGADIDVATDTTAEGTAAASPDEAPEPGH